MKLLIYSTIIFFTVNFFVHERANPKIQKSVLQATFSFGYATENFHPFVLAKSMFNYY